MKTPLELAELIESARWNDNQRFVTDVSFPTAISTYESVYVAVGNRNAFMQVVNHLGDIEVAPREMEHLRKVVDSMTVALARR